MDSIRAIEDEYFKIPKDERVGVTAPDSVVAFINEWRAKDPNIDEKIAEHRAIPAGTKERTAWNKAHPEIKAYWSAVDAFKSANPDVAKWISKDGMLNATKSARSVFVNKHPDLAQYWDWRSAWLKKNPTAQAYLDEYSKAHPVKETTGVPDFGDAGNRVVENYLFSGRPIPPKTKKLLEGYFRESGMTGSFDVWLLSMQAQRDAMQQQGQ
jgi:hypothetical protein